MIFIVMIVFVLFGGLNYYIGLRSWQNVWSFMPIINTKIYWTIFWCVSMSFILTKFIGRYLPSILNNAFEMVGAYWIAVMFYLLMMLLLIDAIRIINRKISFLPNIFFQNNKATFIVSSIVILSLAAIMIYGTWSGRSLIVNKYEIQVNKKCEKIKELSVVMISDLHLGNIVDNSRLTAMMDKINGLKPDIVLIPGDIVDDTVEPFIEQNMGQNFKRLKAKYGVYACLGNHDRMLQSASKTVSVLQNAGIDVIRDKAILIDNSFYLIGRDDETVYRGTNEMRKSLQSILKKVDKSKPIIVMDHQPKQLEIAEREGVDVQVSGHTHKGQLFPSNLITSRIYEIDYGYMKKGNLNVVVSSGIGTWGPPIRIGSRSEIVELILNFN